MKSILFNSYNSLETEVDNQNYSCIYVLPIDEYPFHRNHINLDSPIIAQYTGKFKTQGEQRNQEILIVLENSNLFIQDKKSEYIAELFAESEKDFFLRDDNAQISFRRSKNDKVSGLTLYIDAKQINAKKRK